MTRTRLPCPQPRGLAPAWPIPSPDTWTGGARILAEFSPAQADPARGSCAGPWDAACTRAAEGPLYGAALSSFADRPRPGPLARGVATPAWMAGGGLFAADWAARPVGAVGWAAEGELATGGLGEDWRVSLHRSSANRTAAIGGF